MNIEKNLYRAELEVIYGPGGPSGRHQVVTYIAADGMTTALSEVRPHTGFASFEVKFIKYIGQVWVTDED